MHLKHLALGLAVVMAIPATATAAKAADGLYIPLFTYRTGPFAGSGIPFSDGMHDYYDMLNAR
ncbi:MAG: ABC transporter substrate-binding protein, partial [Bradyrhizobium sp.]